ncbi:MAG: hypothetical protein ACXVBZ_01755 [Flavisolibacter sp.]
MNFTVTYFSWIDSKRIIASFLFVLIVCGSAAQSAADSLRPGNQRSILQEKVFLHTDKAFYLAGETIWFKAYVLDAATNEAMDMSRVLYVELIDGRGKSALQAMIGLTAGEGEGSFLLPSSVGSGAYELRAYTAWMKNNDDRFFFRQTIEIANTTRLPDWTSIDQSMGYTIRFFPEGGQIVEGIPTKLGFDLLDSTGNGIDGSGYVIENNRDTVAHFKTLRFGMGSFDFVAKTSSNYKAIVRPLDGKKTFIAMLPAVEKEGYGLRLKNVGEHSVSVECFCSEQLNGRAVFLLVASHNDVKKASVKFLTAGKAGWILDKAKLAEGVNVVTILDAAQNPVCERLYFKRPEHHLVIGIKTDSTQYERRSKVDINLSTLTERSLPVAANLSLTAFLADSLQERDPVSIEQYIYLTSELQGSIESPSYYFTVDEGVEAATDNLLLVHGWRRFNNKDDLATVPRYLPEYEGPIIKAKAMSKGSEIPVANLTAYLAFPGNRFFATNAISNEKGELQFVTKNMYGPGELTIEAAQNCSLVQINVENAYVAATPPLLPRFTLGERKKAFLMAHHLNVQLEQMEGNELYSLPQVRDTGFFFGKPDYSYRLDDYTRFPTMEEVIKEIVSEVRLQKKEDSFHLRAFNLPFRSYFDSDPLVLFDGVPTFNTNKLIAFDPLKVKQVDVVARKFFWNSQIISGIVSFRTYEGDLAGFELDPCVLAINYNALQVQREFFSPVYISDEQKRSRQPDRRMTLSWIPSIRNDGQEKNALSFYTSDVRGRYIINVQGVGKDGLLGSQSVIIEVN